MAANITAILTACEEIALGTIGTTEVVSPGVFARGVYLPLAIGAAANAFVHTRAEVEISGPHDTGLIPRSSGNAAIEFDVLVRCSFSTAFEIDDNGRRATRATAIAQTELVRAALTRPQNIAQTSGSVATQICGGCLIKASTKVTREDHKARIFVTEITAKALVFTTRP